MPRHGWNSTTISSTGLLVLAMVILQSGAAYAKTLFPLVGPEGATTLRLLFASTILCVAWRPWRHRFSPSERKAVVVYGLALGGMNILIYKAVDLIPLGIAVALEFVGPLAVAVLGSRRWLDLFWVALAACGILLLLPIADFESSLNPWGVLYALMAGVCWGIYIVYGKQVAGTLHGGVVTAVGMSVGMFVALPFGIARAGADLFNWKAIRIAIVVSIFSSVIPYSLEIVALKRIAARTFGVLMALEPVVASVLAVLILGERLTGLQAAAMAMIVAASIGATAFSGEQNQRQPAETDDPEPQPPL